MKPVAYIGADPGLSGAIACLLAESERPLYGLTVVDMPTILTATGKRKLDHKELARLLEFWKGTFDIRGAAVEKVHAMPGQGVTSMFSFGYSFGGLCQALASAGIPVALVHPAAWKPMYGLLGGAQNKGMSRAKATEMFPKFAPLWARKKDDGRAEAALLAHYGSKLQ